MQVFGVFVLWKRASEDSNGYPSIQDIQLVNEESPQPLQDWKAALMTLAQAVNKHFGFLFYNRLDLENGDTLSITFYASEEAFNEMTADNQAEADAVVVERAKVAEFLGLNVEEKRATFEMDAFDYDNAEASKAFFESLPSLS